MGTNAHPWDDIVGKSHFAGWWIQTELHDDLGWRREKGTPSLPEYLRAYEPQEVQSQQAGYHYTNSVVDSPTTG